MYGKGRTMKKYKSFIVMVLFHFFVSMAVLYFSPRFDVITLGAFIVIDGLLFSMLVIHERNQEKCIENKVEDIFSLLYHLDIDATHHEVEEDAFGKLRDEMVKVIVENKRMTEKTIKNEQILKEYTEDIAHQIKTPLTGALLLLDLMEEDRENRREYQIRLRRDLNRLHQLVDILLQLAALDSGTVSMKKEPVSIKALIKDILSDLEIYFPYENFEIPIKGDSFLLHCDRRWTYEALFNIIKNGMEASEHHRIQIYLKETNVFQSVIIEDFSRGLDREQLKKVYQRFYKENPNSKGYGIGLPMAKSVMEKQNGELLYAKGKKSNTFELRFYR